MSSVSLNLSLGEAASRFLSDLPSGEKRESQQEIYRFARWFGVERPLAGLNAPEIANYAERLSRSDTDSVRKLELLRAFLVYAKKEGWSKVNMGIHLKARKGKTGRRSSSVQRPPETVLLTREGYDELEAELADLQGKRLESIKEIRLAAADKDFKENVPLQAARERRGHLEGRLMELEETLKSAAVINEKREGTLTVSIGDSIVLCEIDSDEELRYMLVSPEEVDPTKGKISSASPVGQAVIGKIQGQTVEVIAPAGKLRYQIKQVER